MRNIKEDDPNDGCHWPAETRAEKQSVSPPLQTGSWEETDNCKWQYTCVGRWMVMVVVILDQTGHSLAHSEFLLECGCSCWWELYYCHIISRSSDIDQCPPPVLVCQHGNMATFQPSFVLTVNINIYEINFCVFGFK